MSQFNTIKLLSDGYATNGVTTDALALAKSTDFTVAVNLTGAGSTSGTLKLQVSNNENTLTDRECGLRSKGSFDSSLTDGWIDVDDIITLPQQKNGTTEFAVTYTGTEQNMAFALIGYNFAFLRVVYTGTGTGSVLMTVRIKK